MIPDNLPCDKTAAAARLVAAADAELRFLPPYSPDLNPIKWILMRLNAWPRSAKARTFDGLIGAMGDALHAVCLADIPVWFRHGGYQDRRSTDPPDKKLLQLNEIKPMLI